MSALSPVADSQFIADLFHWITVGAAVIWVAALAILVYCLRAPVPQAATTGSRAGIVPLLRGR